ncbi:MAG TPA: mercuric reductase [Fimbriimonadales bacterium]|nr:mercuric reductase [Fimbriimonadales bacterium]
MKYDVFIIGTGQAGVPLATRLVKVGKKVAIAESGYLGGTCVNTGCTPTKTMIASAKAMDVVRNASRLGVRVSNLHIDFPYVVKRKNEIVRQWRESVREKIEDAGENLSLIKGEARFVGPKEIEVIENRYKADIVIINTGTRPTIPPIRGIESVPWHYNDTIMQLEELPSRLLIIGGGYIGCEFAQMFRRFGSEVTIIEMANHLLATEDSDISETVEQVFRNEGIELNLGKKISGVAQKNGNIHMELEDGIRLEGSHLLCAAGRTPNTDKLNCEAAGIELDERGYIVADNFYRTSADGVYAVGDVLGPFPQFTHSSWDDHRLLFDLLMNKGNRGRSDRVIPFTVFTDPQVARVGKTQKELDKEGIQYEIATMPFENVARAIEIDEPEGMMKVLIQPESEELLGAAIVGAEAGELIHIFVPLMYAHVSMRAIVESEFVHPTFAEGVQSLVMRLPRYSL